MQQKPVLLFKPRTNADRAIRIACGANHLLILSTDGTLRTLGCSETGQLGRLSKEDAEIQIIVEDENMAQHIARLLEPMPVPGLGKVVDIAAVRLILHVAFSDSHTDSPGLLQQLRLSRRRRWH